MKNIKVLFVLIAILAAASFFRLWKLSSVPPGLYPDVAINGNEALTALKSGNYKIFYPENNGREGLFMNLIALSFAIFGVSIWSIKIVAAIFGILTVLGLYLLTRELFSGINPVKIPSEFNGAGNQQLTINSEAIALLSAFFLTISFWHTNFSRIGFRAISLPFAMVFSFYFLLKGLKTKKIMLSLIGGIFFALGFYTYTSFRFAVLLLPVVFIPAYFFSKKESREKEIIKAAAYFLIATFIIALPIGIYFLKNPADFIGRAAPISVFNSKNPIFEFAKSLALHLEMFNVYGDGNWRHNLAKSPMLFWPIGILFLIGFFSSVINLIKSIRKKNSSFTNSYLLIVSWFFIMILPGALTKEGVPHALRVVGVIPVVYIFVGLGSWLVYSFLANNNRKKKLVVFTAVLFLLAMTCYEFNKYFVVWGQSKVVKDEFSSNYVVMANYLNSLGPEIKKYVIVNQDGVAVPWPNGIPMPAQTIIFIESAKYGSPQSIYLKTGEINQIRTDGKKTEVILMQNDSNIFVNLKTKFPRGIIRQENGIWRFEINF